MKKLRTLFVLALALTLALSTVGIASAAYGPSGDSFFDEDHDGVAGVRVTVILGGDGVGFSYDANDRTFQFIGSGKAEVCWPDGAIDQIFVNGVAAATYKIGNAKCATFFTPAFVAGVK